MKGFFLILAVLLVMFAMVFAATAPAHAGNGCGNCNNFGSQGFGGFGFHGQNFHGQNFNNFGFHGQNFNNNAQFRGANSVFSAGGRARVFVGFDRNGNPVFR